MQRPRPTDERIARCAAMCIVVGLHIVAVILIWKARDVPPSSIEDAHAIWLRLDQPVEQAIAPTQPATPEESFVRPRELETPPPAPRTEQSPAQASPAQQIDWSAQAALTAKNAVEESVTERYRNFGPRKPPPKEEPAPPSLFEPEHDVKGEIGEDVLGNPVVRLSEHCYQELEDKRAPTDRRGDLAPPLLPKCMFRFGKRKARGDLFDHLKKERPLPQRKESVKSELPERVEDENADP